MKTKKRISHKNLPHKIPLNNIIICLLVIKVYNTPEWLTTLIYVWIVLSLSFSISLIIKHKYVDIFKDDSN